MSNLLRGSACNYLCANANRQLKTQSSSPIRRTFFSYSILLVTARPLRTVKRPVEGANPLKSLAPFNQWILQPRLAGDFAFLHRAFARTDNLALPALLILRFGWVASLSAYATLLPHLFGSSSANIGEALCAKLASLGAGCEPPSFAPERSQKSVRIIRTKRPGFYCQRAF